MKVKDFKNTAVGFLSAALLFSGFNFISAYFTDAEKATNTFTVGNVKIESVEPNYPGNDSNPVKNITPSKEIAKDPKAVNKGVNDAIIFVTLDSPLENVTVMNDDGTTSAAKAVNEIFWYKDANDAINVHRNNFDSNWLELTGKEKYVKISADGLTETKVEDDELATTYAGLQAGEHIVKRYVFGYKEQIQGSSTTDGDAQTATNNQTTELFDKIQLKNVKENEIDKRTENVVVRTYAIQAENLLDSTGTDISTTLNAANLATIYDMFVKQNSTGNDGTGLKVTGLRDVDAITTDADGTQHHNRWDTTADVSAEGRNVKPSN